MMFRYNRVVAALQPEGWPPALQQKWWLALHRDGSAGAPQGRVLRFRFGERGSNANLSET